PCPTRHTNPTRQTPLESQTSNIYNLKSELPLTNQAHRTINLRAVWNRCKANQLRQKESTRQPVRIGKRRPNRTPSRCQPAVLPRANTTRTTRRNKPTKTVGPPTEVFSCESS